MQIILGIDDTDNLESRGTGELASLLATQLEEKGWGQSRFVSRHQLLVHPDIPYTSHNSAMCFAAELDPAALEPLIAHAGDFLDRESAPGSDPGLCVAAVQHLAATEELLAFGRLAKTAVLSKEQAYALAGRLGVHLSEHGGSGQGVIGALAGVALRLGGCDGRLKGRLQLGAVDETLRVAELLAHPLIDAVRTLKGETPAAEDRVQLGEKIKTVLQGGESVLLVCAADEAAGPVRWRTCSRQQLKNF